MVTPWLDLTAFYGQNETDAKLLRTLDYNGQTPGELISLPLPVEEEVLPYDWQLIQAIKGIPANSNPASLVLNFTGARVDRRPRFPVHDWRWLLRHLTYRLSRLRCLR